MTHEEKADRWQISIRDLMVSIMCFCAALSLLMTDYAKEVGVLVLVGVVCGLIENRYQQGRYMIGFCWGCGIPLMAILFVHAIYLLEVAVTGSLGN